MHLQIYTIIFILKWLVIQMIYPPSNSFLNEQKILWVTVSLVYFFVSLFLCSRLAKAKFDNIMAIFEFIVF